MRANTQSTKASELRAGTRPFSSGPAPRHIPVALAPASHPASKAGTLALRRFLAGESGHGARIIAILTAAGIAVHLFLHFAPFELRSLAAKIGISVAYAAKSPEEKVALARA